MALNSFQPFDCRCRPHAPPAHPAPPGAAPAPQSCASPRNRQQSGFESRSCPGPSPHSLSALRLRSMRRVSRELAIPYPLQVSRSRSRSAAASPARSVRASRANQIADRAELRQRPALGPEPHPQPQAIVHPHQTRLHRARARSTAWSAPRPAPVPSRPRSVPPRETAPRACARARAGTQTPAPARSRPAARSCAPRPAPARDRDGPQIPDRESCPPRRAGAALRKASTKSRGTSAVSPSGLWNSMPSTGQPHCRPSARVTCSSLALRCRDQPVAQPAAARRPLRRQAPRADRWCVIQPCSSMDQTQRNAVAVALRARCPARPSPGRAPLPPAPPCTPAEQHHPPSKTGVSRRRHRRSQPEPQRGLAQVAKMPALEQAGSGDRAMPAAADARIGSRPLRLPAAAGELRAD